MTGGSRIIALGSAGDSPSPDDAPIDSAAQADEAGPALAQEPVWDDANETQAAPSGHRFEKGAMAAAAIAVALWTGFFVWAHWRDANPLSAPTELAALVSEWATVVLLVGVLWLLVMRNSRREANRFAATARMLSTESMQLEARLVTINQELSLAREFIASQSRDLEALGRVASDRLSQNAERLQNLIQDNGSQIDAIGNVSHAALDNMEKLRGQLPVIASSAKDVTNNIGNAGRTAQDQLAEMVSGFKRINEFGEACNAQVRSLREVVDETMAEFSWHSEQLETITKERFAELTARGSEFRTQLDTQEVQALAAIRSRASALAEELDETRQRLDRQEAESLTSLRARLSALRDESGTISRALQEKEDQALASWRSRLDRLTDDQEKLFAAIEQTDRDAAETARMRLGEIRAEAERIDAELAARRATAEAGEREAVARLGEVFANLDGEIARRASEHERHAAEMADHASAIAATMAQYEQRMATISSRAADIEERLSVSLQRLADRLSDTQSSLSGTERDVGQLTEASARLLELIRSSAAHSREDLPQALLRSEEQLAALDERIRTMRLALDRAGHHGALLAGRIETSGDGLRTILADLERLQSLLQERSTAYEKTLESLRGSLEGLEQQSDRLSEKGQWELTEALEKLGNEIQEAVASIEERGAAGVSALALRFGRESGEAIEKAMRTRAAEATGQLEQAAAHAAGVSREAALQLRDQLAAVNELVANLEQRVTRARQQAEEQVDNGFARRVALITESLNSHSVDIAKALSTDVSDTAWAAYLRGDRGIFTRRAVRLIDAHEAKTIQQIFERDTDFREHVSRYIHDFEAILRQILSTRDGNVLGITLLSSDMGKLYVALAQAIERLR